MTKSAAFDHTMPPYAFVPGGPWPHPTGSPQGHSAGRGAEPKEPIQGDHWSLSEAYLRGVALFNAGYYWEAHESWEALWHAHGRRGPTAELLKGLIKLAASGVKVRQRQRHGVVTHAQRAAAQFAIARDLGGRNQLGLDLDYWEATAQAIAAAPPDDPAPLGTRVSCVFAIQIKPI
jgi:predicted metal-dependent hydrolase